jgi:hypothetical protein
MWVSSTMDGNRQVGKWLIIKCHALKWAKVNSAPPKGSSWWVPMVNGMTLTCFHDYGDCKTNYGDMS